jgi:hypothetical protein
MQENMGVGHYQELENIGLCAPNSQLNRQSLRAEQWFRGQEE